MSYFWQKNSIPKLALEISRHIAASTTFVTQTRRQVLQLDLGLLDLATLLHEEDMWLKGGESLCGAKTAGFSIKDAKPCSPGRKVAHWLKGGEWDA